MTLQGLRACPCGMAQPCESSRQWRGDSSTLVTLDQHSSRRAMTLAYSRQDRLEVLVLQRSVHGRPIGEWRASASSGRCARHALSIAFRECFKNGFRLGTDPSCFYRYQDAQSRQQIAICYQVPEQLSELVMRSNLGTPIVQSEPFTRTAQVGLPNSHHELSGIALRS